MALHTREVPGSIPGAPIGKSLLFALSWCQSALAFLPRSCGMRDSASGGWLEASLARRGGGLTRPAMPPSARDGVLRDGYDTGGFYDEAFELGPDGVAAPRAHYAELVAQIASMDGRGLRRAAELANRSFLHRGVTFTVYSDEKGTER